MKRNFDVPLLTTALIAGVLITGEVEATQTPVEAANPVPPAQIGALALARQNAGGGVSAPHRGHRHPQHQSEGGISAQHNPNRHAPGGISPLEA